MLNSLLTSLGIDERQWRALVRTSWRNLWRTKSSMGVHAGWRKYRGVAAGLVMYAVAGVLLAVVSATAPSAGTAAFVLLCFLLVYLSSLVLLEFGSSIVSPDDILILAPRPVSSRTYFAARLAIILVFVSIYGVALGGPATVTFLMRFGPVAAIAWIIAFLAEGTFAALAMVLIYTLALRYAPASRIRTVVGFVQMILSLAIYGGFTILSKQMPVLFAIAENRPSWFVVLPPSWYASIVSLAAGEGLVPHIVWAAAAVLAIAALGLFVNGKIALDYVESAAGVAVAPTGKARRTHGRVPRLIRVLRQPEARAIALLIFRQFRHDTKFKMAVLSIIPLTVLYVILGLQQGETITDPFLTDAGKEFSGPLLLYFAAIIFPTILKEEISRSDAYQSSWVFFASPLRRGELVVAMRRVITSLFLTPYMIFLGLIFLYFFRNIGHTLMHVAVLFLVCDLLLNLNFLVRPRLPFSTPRTTGSRTSSVIGAMIIGPILLFTVMAIFTNFLYRSYPLYFIGILVLGSASLLLRWALKSRAARVTEALEFMG